jgi:nitrate reductase gamma subunit
MHLDTRMTVFWIAHLIMLGLWVLLMLYLLSIWLKSRVPGVSAKALWWRKAFVAIGYILGIVFGRRLWPLLKSFILDGLLQRRLFQKNKLRWITHMMVFGSFLVMGVVSTITGVVVEGLPLFGMDPEKVAQIPILGQLFHADVWWVALVNELLGLVLLAGMLLVLYRRFVKKDPQLRTGPIDNTIILLLTLIAFSGIFTETFRLLADYTTAAKVFAPDPSMLPVEKYPLALYGVFGPKWGFVGYGLAWLLGLLKLSQPVWNIVYNIVFWLHFVIVSALLYYLPFSRFAHVIAGPVVVAYDTMLDKEKARARSKAGHAKEAGAA